MGNDFPTIPTIALPPYLVGIFSHSVEGSDILQQQAFSIAQLARRLDVCERTARRLIEGGELKAYRVGRQWRVFEPDLQEYLARQANRRRCRHNVVGRHDQ